MTHLTTSLAFFSGGLGATEIAMIVAVAVLLFGKRLPEVGRSLGKGIIEFKKGVKGIEDDINDEMTKAEEKADEKKALDADVIDVKEDEDK